MQFLFDMQENIVKIIQKIHLDIVKNVFDVELTNGVNIEYTCFVCKFCF